MVAAFSQAGTRVRYIFQRINGRIFKDPETLMDKILRVTSEAQHQDRAEVVVLDDLRTGHRKNLGFPCDMQ
ncbi:MAG: hypothetical protein NTV93_08920 [Verrucomicrobia bacterium]|nr:hypothetical protein [Verrucomicrobiota bacterium]